MLKRRRKADLCRWRECMFCREPAYGIMAVWLQQPGDGEQPAFVWAYRPLLLVCQVHSQLRVCEETRPFTDEEATGGIKP